MYSWLFFCGSASLLAHHSPRWNKSWRHLKEERRTEQSTQTQWRQYAALHWCKEQYCCCPAKWFVALGHAASEAFVCFLFFKFSALPCVSGLMLLFILNFKQQFYSLILMPYFTWVTLPGVTKMERRCSVLHSYCGTFFKPCSAHCWPRHLQTSWWKKAPDGQPACVIQTGVNILVVLHAKTSGMT